MTVWRNGKQEGDRHARERRLVVRADARLRLARSDARARRRPSAPGPAAADAWASCGAAAGSREPPPLGPGDEVTMEVQGIGRIANRIVAGAELVDDGRAKPKGALGATPSTGARPRDRPRGDGAKRRPPAVSPALAGGPAAAEDPSRARPTRPGDAGGAGFDDRAHRPGARGRRCPPGRTRLRPGGSTCRSCSTVTRRTICRPGAAGGAGERTPAGGRTRPIVEHCKSRSRRPRPAPRPGLPRAAAGGRDRPLLDAMDPGRLRRGDLDDSPAVIELSSATGAGGLLGAGRGSSARSCSSTRGRAARSMSWGSGGSY